MKQAVCNKLQRDNNLQYAPEQIVISTGAKQSLANVILSLVDEGDEVLIPTPYWVTYAALVQLAKGEVIYLPSSLETGYKITAAQLEAAITPKTKLFIFSSPCNPSGAIYSREELATLVAVFEKHPQVLIISDEIYEYINYCACHESIASFQSLKDRVIVINGLSKGFAMTGWRLGYLAAPAPIAKACEKLQGQFTSAPNAITQRAAITALSSSLEPTKVMVAEFTRRKDRVMELMKEIAGFEFGEPEGAFYAFPRVSHYFGKADGSEVIRNADDLSMYLLNTANVSTVTGSAFGNNDCIRISFANSMENIEKGFARITKALSALN